MITLVLGGNKSGKSAFALDLLAQGPGPSVLLATGRARDLHFRRQILAHRENRDPDIPVIEVGTDLPERMIRAKSEYASVLVDSLDFWLFACREEGLERVPDFLTALEAWNGGNIVLVSCEIGLGPLPIGEEARAFVRELGGLNQNMAALAQVVYFTIAGLPLTLKKA
ncbi:MAG TPA: cobalamin biosynthesis protein [Desulfovibrio sp.]|jgi:adenosylcobinamide kinase/adenosylcobinamide-phosphate guanylyltransferase|nr:cobalamin biosynthesis protein [Desulfovibrio sp.]HBR06100.1 cobalamin biosynthesis protein [Desulfovibrio sp.]